MKTPVCGGERVQVRIVAAGSVASSANVLAMATIPASQSEAHVAEGVVRPLWRRIFPAVVGVSVAVGSCIAYAVAAFGSVYHGWLYATGVRVVVEPTVMTIADAKVGDSTEATFLVYNLTSEPVRVLGAMSSCSCVSVNNELPLLVPPNGRRQLRVGVEAVSMREGEVQRAVYYTDHPGAPRIVARVRRRVVGR